MYKSLTMKTRSKLPKLYTFIITLIFACTYYTFNIYASTTGSGGDMWAVANTVIVDLYNKIAGISTVLAGLMSAIAVLGAKLSNNQHKVDQSWDWLRRIWVAWAVINGIGAFIAYIRPLFAGLNTIG